MAKISTTLTEYQRYPRYPKGFDELAPPAVVTLKSFFNLKWSESQQITNQIMAAVIQGANANGGKTTNATSMGKWRDLLQPHVYSVLLSAGDWAKDGANVLSAAQNMGDIAATITSGSECKENQLKAAYSAARASTVCTSGGSGGGNWCTFDWI
jgi:hypothetical protein